jgi:DNA-binding transcriptional LysR family regulator
MLNRISLRQMEYFVATAECGSIITASERIHVSSPSISAAVSHIESELQVQLFIRHHAKGLTLTPIGTQVMIECKHILDHMGSLYAIASESANSIRGPLRVGCFQALAPMISPEVVFGFSQAFPAVRITQVEGDQETLMEKLRNMEIDIALTYDLHVNDDIAFEPLAQLPPHVIVGELHPLAERNAVTLEELAEYPMILLDMPQSNAYFMSLFLSEGLQPNITARSANSDVVRAMVANHMGYALFNVRPKSNHSLDGRRIVRIRLAGKHRPMQLGMAVNNSRLVNAFMQRCRAYISDQYIPGMSAPRFFDPREVLHDDTKKLAVAQAIPA